MFKPKSLIPFVTAGHPTLSATRDIVVELANAGAGLIEIGIPFSDPIADGPVIQRSSFDALRHGYSIGDYLGMIREVRSQTDVPLIFMTYLNPVLHFGLERLDREGAAAGLNGLLISDLMPEDYGRPEVPCLKHLKTVFLVAPTSSDERIAAACEAANGFVYVVARTGVTGKQTEVGEGLRRLSDSVRKRTEVPVAVGFGLRTREDVRKVWAFADGAVIGSSVVDFIERHRELSDLPARVAVYFRSELLP